MRHDGFQLCYVIGACVGSYARLFFHGTAVLLFAERLKSSVILPRISHAMRWMFSFDFPHIFHVTVFVQTNFSQVLVSKKGNSAA